jgi:hypothetical protein
VGYAGIRARSNERDINPNLITTSDLANKDKDLNPVDNRMYSIVFTLRYCYRKPIDEIEDMSHESAFALIRENIYAY